MFNTQEMKYLYVTIMLIKTMLKFWKLLGGKFWFNEVNVTGLPSKE